MRKSARAWRICIAVFILLSVISFTPLIIPQAQFKPELLGIPYSLWTSFLVTVSLVVLTFIGSRVHPGSEKEEGMK